MTRPALLLSGALAALLAACATAPAPVAGPPPQGYLGPVRAAALTADFPAPPQPGSDVDQTDRAAVERSRALAGGPRWTVAQADAELDPPVALQRFDCVLGVRLAAAKPKALTQLFRLELYDVAAAWAPVKSRWFRQRPDAALKLAPCTATDPNQPQTSSWPAGHAAAGWVWAKTLAELAPDRADALLARGRSIGDSRVVCGLHYPSDVDAGRQLGETVWVALQADPAWRRDLEAARGELATIRTRPAPDAACVAETRALALAAW